MTFATRLGRSVLFALVLGGVSLAQAETLSPQSRFATRVTERSQAGWHLRGLEVDDRGQDLIVRLTLANSDQAETLSLGYSDGKARFVAYSEHAQSVPVERRQYQDEDSLLQALARSAPTGIEVGCENYFLSFGDHGVSLDPAGYTVVVDRADEAASAAAAQWLSELLEDGELVDVRDESAWLDRQTRRDTRREQSLGHWVVFVVDGFEGPHAVAARLGPTGKVVAAELRHTPSERQTRSYRRNNALRQALRKASRLEMVAILPGSWEDGARVQLAFDTGLETVVLDDFAVRDPSCLSS